MDEKKNSFLPALHSPTNKHSVDSDNLPVESDKDRDSRTNSLSRWSKKSTAQGSLKPYESIKMKSRFAMQPRTDSKDKTESSLTHSRVDSSSVASDKRSAEVKLGVENPRKQVLPSKFNPQYKRIAVVSPKPSNIPHFV